MTDDSAPRSEPRHGQTSSTIAVGLVLVLGGAALLAGQMLGIGVDDVGWPFLVIAIGAVLLVVGIVSGDRGMIIAGTVVTTVGLVLLYQDQTGRWETWAYGWALVGPAASGLGLALWGIRSGDASDVRNGTWGLLGGLALFGIGFLFFEGVVGIGGDRLAFAEWLLPAAIIGIGLVVLVRGIFERRQG